MIKKRTSLEVVPAIILIVVLLILGVCLFLLLQHVPMKQITYSVNETKQVKQAQQVTQSKQAQQAQQVMQAAPILLPIHVPEERIVKFTPVRNKIAYIPIALTNAPIKLTRMFIKKRTLRKRSRKMHYVEVVPERRS
jgi:hypothetical protein